MIMKGNGRQYILFLISPRQRFINYPAHSELAKMFGKKRFMIPLALPTIAALTPGHYNIRIIDEEIEDLPGGIIPDIVGITTLAATARRAFELGDKFRRQGVKVVYGGPYASFKSEEALKHGDSVVVGEAEGKWEQCLADFESGKLKPVYSSDSFIEYKKQAPPRWDLVNMKRIFQVAIQVSRGCPFNCDFCLVSKNFGRKMRYREIENVVEEIKAAPSKYFFFVDDNLTIHKKYAKDLMRAIIPLGISWGCMCSIDVADDDELLQLMAEAGCFNILVGFESLNPESLDETHKHHNRGGKFYAEAIRKIHAAGIHINASFVVGFDNDGLEAFDRIFDFTFEHSLPYVNLHLLNAPPGTELHKKLEAEGRLLYCDPELGVGHFPTIHYRKMTQLGIFDKYMETIARLYSFDTIRKKGETLLSNGAFIRKGGEISVFMKARLSWITFREYVLTSDKERKKLFHFVFKLIRSKQIAIDKGLGFLLSMLGYHRHILAHQRNMEEYRQIVIAQEKSIQPGIQSVGIIGEGKMGSNIFYYLLDFDFQLVWIGSPESNKAEMQKVFEKKLKRKHDTGIISPDQYRQKKSEIIISTDLNQLADCDLIIEAIPENLEQKKSLFSHLDGIARPDCILTSNSSSINPGKLVPSEKRKQAFTGLHFFYPLGLKNIVEIIFPESVSREVRKKVSLFVEKIQKKYLVLDENNSFILNRIFLDFQNEAYHLVENKHLSMENLDDLVKKHFFPFGVFDFMDSVGLDTMLTAIKNYTVNYPHKNYYEPLIHLLEKKVALGQLGKKTGKGFYPSDGIENPDQDFPAEDIVHHLKQSFQSSAKRFTMQSHSPIHEMNDAIKEYFELEKGPFEI